jgi:hypothetical protein
MIICAWNRCLPPKLVSGPQISFFLQMGPLFIKTWGKVVKIPIILNWVGTHRLGVPVLESIVNSWLGLIHPRKSFFSSNFIHFHDGIQQKSLLHMRNPQHIVYSFSSDPEGEWKNCQRVLKFLPLIFGSETSKQVKWVRNVRVDYRVLKKE